MGQINRIGKTFYLIELSAESARSAFEMESGPNGVMIIFENYLSLPGAIE